MLCIIVTGATANIMYIDVHEYDGRNTLCGGGGGSEASPVNHNPSKMGTEEEDQLHPVAMVLICMARVVHLVLTSLRQPLISYLDLNIEAWRYLASDALQQGGLGFSPYSESTLEAMATTAFHIVIVCTPFVTMVTLYMLPITLWTWFLACRPSASR
jgi:hypothetical protein